jgi:3'-phosphoadenosine 5'-phosphosulfate sulfotransferase (PAPS reductase)/FAD synthetase
MQQALFTDEWSVSEVYRAVMDNIRPTLRPGRFSAVAVAWSGGKDSSVLLGITLHVLMALQRAGEATVPLVVMNSDTRFENPLVSRLVRSEQAKIRGYIEREGLAGVHLITGQPNRAAAWAVKVIAANGLPPQPGKGACTVDWKITPLRRALKDWSAAHQIRGPILKLTGTRFSESQERGKKMALRGESAQRVVEKDGDYILSPIADLSTDQVWEVMAAMRGGELPGAYTDFDDLLEVYASAGGASCPLVGEYRMGGTTLGSCESRTGCAICTKVAKDKSLENMLEAYPALKPLYRLREFVAAIMHDHSRRVWIGRTIDEHGYITIQPDAFAPGVCRDLLRYCLTIDADEAERARDAGEARLFDRLIDLETLVLIDFYWTIYGLHARPYEAWRIWLEVAEGARFYPPEINPVPAQPMPPPRFLYVGDGWFEEGRHWSGGLRDLLAEALEADTPAAYPLRMLRDGRTILEYPTGPEVAVNTESGSFWDWFQFLLPDAMAEAEGEDSLLMLHSRAVRLYLECEVVSYRDHGVLDTMLRRMQYRQRNGIGRDARMEDVMPRTISETQWADRTGQSRRLQRAWDF